MTDTTTTKTCDCCGKAKPLHKDTSGNGDGMICVSCQEMVNMGLDWIQSAITYLQDPPARRMKINSKEDQTRIEGIQNGG